MRYLITYDLNSPGQYYEELYKAIKGLGDWIHAMQNTWFIKSRYSAKQIRDHLTSVIDHGDKLFVCEINDWAAYGISDAGNWLNNHA